MGTFIEIIGVVVTMVVVPWGALAVAISARKAAKENDDVVDDLIDCSVEAAARLDTHSELIADIIARLAAVEGASTANAHAASITKAKH